MIAQDYITQGGIGYAKQVLEKALGARQAATIINRLTSTLQVRPFDFARKADPDQILNFIQNEHPQTIALILILFGSSTSRPNFIRAATRNAGRCCQKNCLNG